MSVSTASRRHVLTHGELAEVAVVNELWVGLVGILQVPARAGDPMPPGQV
jgi:hypothetical protein